MANEAKSKEGIPFVIFMLVLLLGSMWVAAGANFSAFGVIWNAALGEVPRERDDAAGRLEELARIPRAVKFPRPKIIPPPEIAIANEAMQKMPGPRPPLAQLAAEGKLNPFLPKWVQEMLIPVALDPNAANLSSANNAAQQIPEDSYTFHGIAKIKEDPPFAVLHDEQKKMTVFLRAGESYGPIQTVDVRLEGATFQVGQIKFEFDTIHSSNKTMKIRRSVPGQRGS